MSYLLFWKIFSLHTQYQFRNLSIVVHSMGGLVVRSYLTTFAYSLPFDSGVTGWFYRSDILGEAGYTHDDLVDITWEKFM